MNVNERITVLLKGVVKSDATHGKGLMNEAVKL